ncbi:MAG: hypothetical protein M1835_002407 [Candelina submexicana]|nr:MAG: hypothetical protein M1835_002407 [Candelina submexicana]
MASYGKMPDGFHEHMDKLGFREDATRVRLRFYQDLRSFHEDPEFPRRKYLNTKTDEHALNLAVWDFLKRYGYEYLGPEATEYRKRTAAIWDRENKEEADELHMRVRSAYLYLTSNFLKRHRSHNQPSNSSKNASKHPRSFEGKSSDDDSCYHDSSVSSSDESESEPSALPRPSRNRKTTWYLKWVPGDPNEVYPVIHREPTTTREKGWYVRVVHGVNLPITLQSTRPEGGTYWLLEGRDGGPIRVIKKPNPSNSGYPVHKGFAPRPLREEVMGARNDAALAAYSNKKTDTDNRPAGQQDQGTILVGSPIARFDKGRAATAASANPRRELNIEEPSVKFSGKYCSPSLSQENLPSLDNLRSNLKRDSDTEANGYYADVLMNAAAELQPTPLINSSMPPSNNTNYKTTPAQEEAATASTMWTSINNLSSAGEQHPIPVYQQAAIQSNIVSSQSTVSEGHDVVEEWSKEASAARQDTPVTGSKRPRSSMEAPFHGPNRVNKAARIDSPGPHQKTSRRSMSAFDEVGSDHTLRDYTPLTSTSSNIIGRPSSFASAISPREASKVGAEDIFHGNTPHNIIHRPSLSVNTMPPREASKIKAKICMQSQSAKVTKLLPAALTSEAFFDTVHKAWRLDKNEKKFDYIDVSLGSDTPKERVWLHDEECFEVLMDAITEAMADGRPRCELEITIPL